MTATSSVHTRYKRLTPIQRLPYRHLRVLNVIGYLRDTPRYTEVSDTKSFAQAPSHSSQTSCETRKDNANIMRKKNTQNVENLVI